MFFPKPNKKLQRRSNPCASRCSEASMVTLANFRGKATSGSHLGVMMNAMVREGIVVSGKLVEQ